ncbi:MAG TPA: zf-HC2 domain-containing protein [Vicinamibacterales bacterium]|nr:zf-HC2 domain-containing protein [Vicinamibacterales bacterium]
MQCAEARSLADSFVAGELPTQTSHRILRHLDTCAACRADVQIRRRTRADLRQAFLREPELAPSPELTTRLREHLRRHARAMEPRSRRRPFMRWTAAAAACVLACTGLLWVYQAVLSDTLIAAAVGDHRHCTLPKDGPLSFADTALQQPAYRRLEALPQTISSVRGEEIVVLHRHVCVYGRRRFVHLMLRHRGERLSLVVSGAADQPSDPFRAARIDGMNVVTFRSGAVTLFVIGELSFTDLRAIATLVEQHLRQS